MSDEKKKTVAAGKQQAKKSAAENGESAAADSGRKAEIAIIDERTIRDKIYEVRGVKVMLDFELAEIYGYTTSAFNQQVRRNSDRFPEDFRFQLTKEEFTNLLSQNVTASWGGDRRAEPWAFSESGIYMLMTVLKGDLAIKQSISLIRIFQSMKDYIVENQALVTQRDLLRLSMQTAENADAIRGMHTMISDQKKILHEQQRLLMKHDDLLSGALEEIGDTVKRSEISPVLLQFSDPDAPQEYLLFNKEPAKADETYMSIYAQAKKTLFIVDNYINIKTMRQLQSVRKGVKVTVFSDNLNHNFHLSDYNDFHIEYPHIPVTLHKTGGIMHDRFIILDYGSTDERMFHCGASAKDAAIKLTTAIVEITSADMKMLMHTLIDNLLKNPKLQLR